MRALPCPFTSQRQEVAPRAELKRRPDKAKNKVKKGGRILASSRELDERCQILLSSRGEGKRKPLGYGPREEIHDPSVRAPPPPTTLVMAQGSGKILFGRTTDDDDGFP